MQTQCILATAYQAKHQTGDKPNAEQWEQVGQLMNKPGRVCKRRFGLLMKSQHWDSTMQTLIDQVNLRKTRAVPGHAAPGYIYIYLTFFSL